MILWLLGCGGAPAEVPLQAAPAELFRELLAADATSAAPGAPGTVAFRGEGLWAWDVRSAEPTALDPWADSHGELHAGALSQGLWLLAVGEELWAWDGTLWPSPLDSRVPGPVHQLQPGDAEGLWLCADEVFHWLDGELKHIRVDGAAASGPVAPGARVGGEDVTWLAAGDQVVALGTDGSSRASAHFEDVAALATDDQGNAWLADGQGLWFHPPGGEAWAPVRGIEGVETVLAGARVWVASSDGGWVGDAAGLAPAELGAGVWQGLDEAGRLLIATEAGIERVTTGRAVRLLDLPELLDGTTQITVAPSTSAEVSQVLLSVDGDSHALTGPPWAWTLDSAGHVADTILLDVTVRWSDGGEASTSASVAVVPIDVDPTWEGVIEPLFQDRCAACHSGDSATVLDDKQAWIDAIDRILEQVEAGTMPLTGEPLSDTEIDWIQDWQAAGFP